MADTGKDTSSSAESAGPGDAESLGSDTSSGAGAGRTQLDVTQVRDGGCACGCADDGIPALDVHVIPHAIRHATIFGAIGGLRPGQQMDLVADHEPRPLLAQLAEREGEAVSYEYLERGPQTWTLRFTRRS